MGHFGVWPALLVALGSLVLASVVVTAPRRVAALTPITLLLSTVGWVESHALRDRQARVSGEPGVPGGPRAPQVGGAAPGLIELRVLASGAQPRVHAKLEPRGVRRLAGHEKKGMRAAGGRVRNPARP